MSTIKIGLIAYDFPPFNSGGSQRPYLLVRYLASMNVDVTVFTLSESEYPPGANNYNVETGVATRVRIVRASLRKRRPLDTLMDSYYVNVVDNIGARWKNDLLRAIHDDHNTQRFDYLFFTLPPFSLAPLAVWISRKLNVGLVVDFRDAWSQWVVAPYASYFHYRKTLKLEREVIRQASVVTYTSDQQRKDWLTLHPDIDPKKFVYMPNGFEEYKRSAGRNSERITIFYSGSFYFNPKSHQLIQKPWYKKRLYQYLQYVPRVEEWNYRSPYFFLAILEQVFQQNPTWRQKVKVRFAGKKPAWFDAMVDSFGLKNEVVHIGFVNKDEIRDELEQADFLLVTSSKVSNGRDYSVAGKTFEYFAYKKPIIGVVCEGEQKDVLGKSGLSLILDPDDVRTSAERLKMFLENPEVNADLDYIEQFKIPNNYQAFMQRLIAGKGKNAIV